LRKFWGAKGLCVAAHPVGGSGGVPPAPRKLWKFRPSEIASGAFFRPFVILEAYDEMTIFLVLIRHLTPIVQVTLVLIRHLGVIAE